MPKAEIDEFGKTLVQQVRDAAMRNCDILLDPEARSRTAQRWHALDAKESDLRVVIADVVDVTLFYVLHAIDQGLLPLRYTSSIGREVDLAEAGLGELAGWYMASDGWRAMYSRTPFVDDAADVGG